MIDEEEVKVRRGEEMELVEKLGIVKEVLNGVGLGSGCPPCERRAGATGHECETRAARARQGIIRNWRIVVSDVVDGEATKMREIAFLKSFLPGVVSCAMTDDRKVD